MGASEASQRIRVHKTHVLEKLGQAAWPFLTFPWKSVPPVTTGINSYKCLALQLLKAENFILFSCASSGVLLARVSHFWETLFLL